MNVARNFGTLSTGFAAGSRRVAGSTFKPDLLDYPAKLSDDLPEREKMRFRTSTERLAIVARMGRLK
jgi:hypothetical protein